MGSVDNRTFTAGRRVASACCRASRGSRAFIRAESASGISSARSSVVMPSATTSRCSCSDAGQRSGPAVLAASIRANDDGASGSAWRTSGRRACSRVSSRSGGVCLPGAAARIEPDQSLALEFLEPAAHRPLCRCGRAAVAPGYRCWIRCAGTRPERPAGAVAPATLARMGKTSARPVRARTGCTCMRGAAEPQVTASLAGPLPGTTETCAGSSSR